jgi:hypothetical protein
MPGCFSGMRLVEFFGIGFFLFCDYFFNGGGEYCFYFFCLWGWHMCDGFVFPEMGESIFLEWM